MARVGDAIAVYEQERFNGGDGQRPTIMEAAPGFLCVGTRAVVTQRSPSPHIPGVSTFRSLLKMASPTARS